MGGERVSGFEELTLIMADQTEVGSIQFTFPGTRIEPHVDELLSRLEPFVTVRYTGARVEPVQVPDADRYVGVRISRYQRDPVI